MSHPDDGLLQELLDGELPADDEAVVRAHIAGCAPCTAALNELRTMQSEADGIVSRLDLDPPLRVRPSNTVKGGRARMPDLRVLGLAASAVLVAGTSWVLLRELPDRRALSSADAPASASEEVHKQLRAEPPAEAPAPVKAERKAMANAPRPGAVSAAPVLRQKDEVGAVAKRRPAEAPAANAAPATPPGMTLAEAEAQLGWKVHTLAGLTPQSVELLPTEPDSARGVLQRYRVGDAVVVLEQRKTSNEPAQADRGAGMAAAKMAGELGARARRWRLDGLTFELTGQLSADSLDALVKLVR